MTEKCKYEGTCGLRDQIRSASDNYDLFCGMYGTERNQASFPIECRYITVRRIMDVIGEKAKDLEKDGAVAGEPVIMQEDNSR